MFYINAIPSTLPAQLVFLLSVAADEQVIVWGRSSAALLVSFLLAALPACLEIMVHIIK